MFKILLTQNKETVIAISLVVSAFILVAVNVMSFVPGVMEVYSPKITEQSNNPIDTATVNEAINLLNGK